MGKVNFSDQFKRDAVAQITERGYPVAEVSERLGVSQHSLYAWKRQLAKVVSGEASKDAEIRQLKREQMREMLIDRIPESRRPLIDVIVLDLSSGRPKDKKAKNATK